MNYYRRWVINTLLEQSGYKLFSRYNRFPKSAKRGKGYNYLLRLHLNGENIIKIGTTNNIQRRMKEHLRSYKCNLTLLWISPIYSKYTTLRVEDSNIRSFREKIDWYYIRNDRFKIPKDVRKVVIKVRKEYHIQLE